MYLDDGCIAIDNNAAERAIGPLALGRKNHLFAGSEDGGHYGAPCTAFWELQSLMALIRKPI